MRGIYQITQNMAKVHFAEKCRTVPTEIRERLERLHSVNKRASGSGKDYWVDCLIAQGLYEEGEMLRFRPLEYVNEEKPGGQEEGEKEKYEGEGRM